MCGDGWFILSVVWGGGNGGWFRHKTTEVTTQKTKHIDTKEKKKSFDQRTEIKLHRGKSPSENVYGVITSNSS